MNATTLSDWISYAGLYSGFLPVGVAVWRWRHLRGPVWVFAGLQGVGAVIVMLSTWVFTRNNAFLSHIETGLDALAMGLMYSQVVRPRRLARGVLVGGVVFAGAVAVDYWGGFGNHRRGYGYMAGLECLLVSGLLVHYLAQLLGETRLPSLRRHPMFLISVGILAESLVALPAYFFMKALLSYSPTLALRAYDLLFIVVFCANVLYAVAFWFTKKSADLPHVATHEPVQNADPRRP